MNRYKEMYEIGGNLIAEDKRLTLKELEYYIKFNAAWDYPKKFTITELKYWILELFNCKYNQKRTIAEIKKEIEEHESIYDLYDYGDLIGANVYMNDGVYIRPDGSTYDERD